MKLKTLLLGNGPRAVVDYNDVSGVDHDAMAAHALLQAIEAWGKHPGYQGGESWVKHRAAEILAGWLGEEK